MKIFALTQKQINKVRPQFGGMVANVLNIDKAWLLIHDDNNPPIIYAEERGCRLVKTITMAEAFAI